MYHFLIMFAKGVFFIQAEDGIRDGHVTGVQTCALPIPALHPTGSLPEPKTSPGAWESSSTPAPDPHQCWRGPCGYTPPSVNFHEPSGRDIRTVPPARASYRCKPCDE